MQITGKALRDFVTLASLLCAAAIVGLGTNRSLGQEQEQRPPVEVELPFPKRDPTPQPVKPVSPGPSKVFPDGGFPRVREAADGTAANARPGPENWHPELEPPITNYPPPGIYPGEPQHSPQWREFFVPHS